MDVPVGEGRSVMEYELLMTLVCLEHEGIKVYAVPIFQHLRLALGKIGTHCKRG